VEWAAGVHDDVAVPGSGSVGVFWCIGLIPISSKVCINVYIEGRPSWLEDQALVPHCLEVVA